MLAAETRQFLRNTTRTCHHGLLSTNSTSSMIVLDSSVFIVARGLYAFSFRQENCDRVILVSSPTHLPRCLRDACSLWLDPPPPRREGTGRTTGHQTQNADTTNHGGQGSQESINENGGGEKERRRRRPWRPLVLASPSDTNYAGHGPSDVAIVEPPHRGDHDLGSGSASIPVITGNLAAGEGIEVEDGDLVARNLSGAEETTTPSLLLLHDLVGLALRVRRSSDEVFRQELQELLRRYVDIEE